MARKSTKLTPIADILKQRVISPRQPVLNLMDLVGSWPQIVGDHVAENAFPSHLKNGVLTLKTSSSVWANELKMMEPRLIEAIKEQFPQLKIERLRFVSS